MKSFMGWVGGKNNLKKRILGHFPEEYGRYIEVFGGAAWVLFAKEKRKGEIEVYNDLNGNLVNLFRCIKYHPEELQKELSWLISSREIFFDFTEQLNARGMTDIQRAARFFYTIKVSFGSTGKTFATAPKSVSKTIEYLKQVQQRLESVIIENGHYSKIIKTYDRADALFTWILLMLERKNITTLDFRKKSIGNLLKCCTR